MQSQCDPNYSKLMNDCIHTPHTFMSFDEHRRSYFVEII